MQKLFKRKTVFLLIIFFQFFTYAKSLSNQIKKSRSPSQDLTTNYIEEALQKPHNCRVIVRYVYHSETEKIEIMPFVVKTRSECKDTAKLFEPILDNRIKTKTVQFLWLQDFQQK